MCDIPKMVKNSKELPFSAVKNMIDDAKQLGFEEISMTGCEPLLRKDIFKIIKYANEKNIRTSLCTNGTLIIKNVAKKLALAGLSNASISLEGPKEVHDKIRGKGSFDKVIRAIKFLKEERIAINIATVIIKQNYLYITDVVNIAHKMGIKSIRFQPFSNVFLFDKTTKNKFVLDSEEIEKMKKEIEKVFRLCRKYNIEINPYNYLKSIENYFLGKKFKPEKGCSSPSNSCAIDLNGNLYPCWAMTDIIIGNIMQSRFIKLWDSKKYQKIRQLAKNGNCSGCLMSCYDKDYSEEPLVGNIKLGNLCNNNCLVCSILDKKSTENKSLSKIKKELRQIRKKYNELIISGGEPLLREDATDVIKYARQLGFRYIILRTNGRIFSYMNYCKKIIEVGVDCFQVDLFGHTAELHDSITGVPGSFDQTIQGIKNLVGLNQDVQVNVLITKRNYKELGNIVGFLNFLNISKLKFIFPEPSSNNKEIFDNFIPKIHEAVGPITSGKYLAWKFGMELMPNEITFQLNPNFKKSLEKKPQLKFKFEKYKTSKKVSIIIPTCNRKKLLENTLISLFNQDYPKKDYEIIVIDDGSTDNTEKMIKSLKPPCNFRYYYWPRYKEFVPGSPENRAGPARNIGITKAEGDIVIFIDSDVICEPTLINEHLKYQDKSFYLVVIGNRKELPEVSCKLSIEKIRGLNEKTFDDVREIEYGSCSDDLNRFERPWTLFYSNNISVRKKHLIDVGMFDENFVFWGVEDQEIGYKLFKMGLKFEFNRNAVCYHQFHPTECKDLEDQINALKNNGTIFYKKHLDIDVFNNYRFFIGNNTKSIKIAKMCNNSCLICPILDKKSDKNKTLSEIKKELEQIRKKYPGLIISGGEPTLRKDLTDIIKYAKQLDFGYIDLRTNGRMFYYLNYCKGIVEAGINRFQVDLFGHTAELHDSMTGVSGSFDQTIQGIKNLVGLNQDVQVNVLITKSNYKELIKILKLLNKLRVSCVLFKIPDTAYGTKKKIYFNFKDFIPPYNELGKNLSDMMNYYHNNYLHKEMGLNIIRI